MPSTSNLLTDTHLSSIKDAMSQLTEAIREGDLAKKAGINVEPQYTQMVEQMAKLKAVRETYFPGQ